MIVHPPFPTIKEAEVGSERAKQQLRDIQSRGFRVGYHHEDGGLWVATALYDDHPMYVGSGETQEAALQDLHEQVMEPGRHRSGNNPTND